MTCLCAPISRGFTATQPPSVPPNVSFRDITFTPVPGGVKIVVTTDIPCHLFCRHTPQSPHIHKKPVFRRGIWLNDDVRFCFVTYLDNEQIEPGDTYIHTFLKPGWPVDVTWYIYSWGTVAGTVSPSTSPIFEYHSPTEYPPPPEPIRYAWRRSFTYTGSLRHQAAFTGLAATFQVTATPTTSHQVYLFSKNNDSVAVRVGLFNVDEQDKPYGFALVTEDINLSDGVIDGGDPPTYPVYRQTATLSYAYTPSTRYAVVSISLDGTAQWWINFRIPGWDGDKDEGTENHITEHRTIDNGISWLYAYPGYQAYEAWGYQ